MPLDRYGVLAGVLRNHFRDRPDTQGRWYHVNLEVDALPVDDVYAWARSGRITHALVLNALFLFAPRWAEIKAG